MYVYYLIYGCCIFCGAIIIIIMYTIINMYSSLKTCVKFQSEFSEFCVCNVGLMQGETLSPFLFSMNINDFENELISGVCESM